jgi:hypothetical protein
MAMGGPPPKTHTYGHLLQVAPIGVMDAKCRSRGQNKQKSQPSETQIKAHVAVAVGFSFFHGTCEEEARDGPSDVCSKLKKPQ